jgi:hypothetical protein
MTYFQLKLAQMRGCGRQNKAWGGAQRAEPQGFGIKTHQPADAHLRQLTDKSLRINPFLLFEIEKGGKMI